MHDYIKKFSLQGQVDDNKLIDTKTNLIKTLEDMMREEGFVPSLDIEPQFTVDYKPEFGYFRFVLTVYGVHVGKDDAWRIDGVMAGRVILKSTTPAR